MIKHSSDPVALKVKCGSRLAGSWRVVGFFGLVLMFIPVHLICGLRRRKNPFLVSQRFYQLLMRLLGFHLRVSGSVATAVPVLFVSNHTSYLDVPVMGALIPAAFVAKSEVSSWPLIGWLARLQGTVFIERRSTEALNQSDQLRDHLASKKSLILFPEGTSSVGMSVLPFKSSLFSIVEKELPDCAVLVQPVSVVCSELGGLPIMRVFRPFYAWFGDMTFEKHIWDVFKLGHFTVDVIFHPPVSPQDFRNRKALSAYCEQEISRGVEQCLTGRAVSGNA